METFDYGQLPQMPKLQDIIGGGQPGARIEDIPGQIYGLLGAPQGRMMDIMPGIQNLLMGNNAPAIEGIRQGAASNRASAQSDAMKRGLTGSDIEAANMNMATQGGEQQVGQMMAQQSSVLAQYIMQAMGMDIQANREMFVTLAQALGQQLSSQREMQMFSASQGQASRLAEQGQLMGLIGAGIGAGGMAAGGYLGRK